jgi:site-specific DNA recombinase
MPMLKVAERWFERLALADGATWLHKMAWRNVSGEKVVAKLFKTAFDDGGLSGGTMERPALQRLLADIGEGLIDVVVVYKVDRLTRSLADFAKMVELFDAHGVSFVAVTQQFNTTTSMGRLTLNVLLSFAQFEREVTGERIRDKIAASKRKGMWMGGVPPLGYDVRERRLVANPAEAKTVRYLYERYLELGCVRQLSRELDKRGIVSKVRISQKGIKSGGCLFSRGTLSELLPNPIYIGEIRHQQERHPGQHEAILPREVWERVQMRLNGNAARSRGTSNRSISSPLAGSSSTQMLSRSTCRGDERKTALPVLRTGGIQRICSEIAFSGSHRAQKRHVGRGFAIISRL